MLNGKRPGLRCDGVKGFIGLSISEAAITSFSQGQGGWGSEEYMKI